LTIAGYVALGETEHGYTELQEGILQESPNSTLCHQVAVQAFYRQLRPQLADHLELIYGVDVDLELAPPDHPGFVRRPDLIIVPKAAVPHDDRLIRAADVLAVAEFVAPCSRRLDHVIKRGEYADAGIPHYWIIDLDQPTSIVVCHLVGEFGYQDSLTAIGTVKLDEPFPLTIDLDQLD
jgi:Uma2 family endonuclease